MGRLSPAIFSQTDAPNKTEGYFYRLGIHQKNFSAFADKAERIYHTLVAAKSKETHSTAHRGKNLNTTSALIALLDTYLESKLNKNEVDEKTNYAFSLLHQLITTDPQFIDLKTLADSLPTQVMAWKTFSLFGACCPISCGRLGSIAKLMRRIVTHEEHFHGTSLLPKFQKNRLNPEQEVDSIRLPSTQKGPDTPGSMENPDLPEAANLSDQTYYQLQQQGLLGRELTDEAIKLLSPSIELRPC